MTLPLDHLVLPVADLATARQRLTALGFTVAPDGAHPFGTANCCVYLAGGTFLEPLQVAHPDQASAAIEAGNVFVARDRDHRRRASGDGFSALVFGTRDASADDRRLPPGLRRPPGSALELFLRQRAGGAGTIPPGSTPI